MKEVFEVHPVVNGPGIVKFAWQKLGGNYLAITGSNKVVNVYDRHGEHKSSVLIVLPGFCTSLDWDKDGDILTVAHDKNGILYFWNSHNFDVSKFDTGMKEQPSLCLWSKVSPILAVGTSKGNLLLYNHRTRRKIPTLGKHTKKITSGCWSSQNLLALGSEDRTMTISNAEGDTLNTVSLRAEPYEIQFSQIKLERRNTEETAVSIMVGHKTLFLYDMESPDSPIELAFQQRYGDIMTYKWYGDGYIMIGFSNGYFVVISTHRDEIGQEMFQSRNHKNFLSDVAISNSLNQAASCGDNSIKIHDLDELKEVYTIVDVEEEKGTLHTLGWTDDGQLLTVSTLSGAVLTYLAKLPMLGDACGVRLAYLTSLLEVTIVNNNEEELPLKLEVSVEPNFISLGPFHIAIGMNDRVWIHEIGEQGAVFEKSYLGSVSAMKLNSLYAAVLYDGKVQLHAIDPEGEAVNNLNTNEGSQPNKIHEGRIFPDQGSDEVITCMTLTQEFLVYGTESGRIVFFYIEDWQFINEHRHVLGISKMFPDSTGTKLVVIDEKSDAFVYNPVIDHLLEIPEFPPSIKTVLWENLPSDKHVFVASDTEFVYTYTCYSSTVNGPMCNMVGSTKLPFGHLPLMLCNGEVSCQTLTGKISIMRLNSHIFTDDQGITEDELKASMRRCIVLNKLKDAWSLAAALDSANSWNELAEAALVHGEISIAIRAYQQTKNVSMVYALHQIKDIEDCNLLMGHICQLTGSFDQAQEYFLASSNPVMALEMRRDILNWDQAMNLAKTLAPEEVPYVSKEYAQQLEFTGDFANSLIYYENGITNQDQEHDQICNGGVARMAIRTGDIRRGVSIVQSTNNKTLMRDCASILESMKLYAEAGALYERCQSWDKAAAVYTKIKNWNSVGKLLTRVSSTKIHGQYAKAREVDKKYMEAARAYETAREYDSAIRLYLDHLQLPDDAVRIVKEQNSIEGARMVARFFQTLGDISSALNFLVLSQCQDEAFAMAQSQNCMDQYAEIIGENASTEDYHKIATYFDNTGDHYKAGKFFFASKQYDKALHHFLLCPIVHENESIDMAIKVVSEAKQEALTQRLIDYLIGDVDANPKDAKYLFKLYLAIGQFREAARTAILIAKEDQAAGNYRNAHDMLFRMRSELEEHEIKIPSEMTQNLMILHSYILVKLHVKLGDHMKGARMLVRVANNISKFPSHIVPILTSTVIECHRSGLRNSAFSYATMLMRPEYREKIDPKWKKKIEQIVRKPDKSEVEESLDPCPNCDYPLPQTQLDCPQCKSTLAYCIVTGRHMTKDDWTECPMCTFPAHYGEFVSYLKATDGSCPMCSNVVEESALIRKQPQQHYM